MSPRIVNKKQKKRGIIEAAIRVFADRGVYHFKMIDIAREAKIGKGTIYEYFRDKNELIIGCFEYFMIRYNEILAELKTPELPPEEKIEHYVRASFEFFIADIKITRILYDLWAYLIYTRGGEATTEQLVPQHDVAFDHLADIIREGQGKGVFGEADPMIISAMIHGLLDGIMFQYKTGILDYDSQEMPDKIIDLILNGVLKRP